MNSEIDPRDVHLWPPTSCDIQMHCRPGLKASSQLYHLTLPSSSSYHKPRVEDYDSQPAPIAPHRKQTTTKEAYRYKLLLASDDSVHTEQFSLSGHPTYNERSSLLAGDPMYGATSVTWYIQNSYCIHVYFSASVINNDCVSTAKYVGIQYICSWFDL